MKLKPQSYKAIVAALLKGAKFEIQAAKPTAKGDELIFEAKCPDRQLTITGKFSDPQEDLDLEDTTN